MNCLSNTDTCIKYKTKTGPYTEKTKKKKAIILTCESTASVECCHLVIKNGLAYLNKRKNSNTLNK